jgi:putative ABC transport system permease protein
MIIIIQWDYDTGFDKFHKDYDKLFRVEFTEKTTTQTLLSRPLAEHFIKSSPHIVVGALTDFKEFENGVDI